jgi:hypothetical protein
MPFCEVTENRGCCRGVQLLRIPTDTKNPGKQLNLSVTNYYEDTTALGRHMIKCGILKRDGESVYWLNKK